MDPAAAKALKQLREQNSRLNRLLAEAELEKDALREVAKGNSEPSRQTPRRGHAQDHLGLVGTVGVQAVGLARSTYRRLPIAAAPADPDADLRAWLRRYALNHPCHGFRR